MEPNEVPGENVREFYRRQGEAREQERIIELIANETDYACPDCGDRAISDAIALIKGENKDYPLPLPPKTADNTETAPLSRPMKFKGEK